MIRRHLLPLTKINENGQYVLVQPILIFFAERCIYRLLTTNLFLVIRGRLRPLTKNATNGTYFKYYPSVAFLPSVALGALLTINSALIEVEFMGEIGKMGK